MHNAAHNILVLQTILNIDRHAMFEEALVMRTGWHLFYVYNSGRIDGFTAYTRQIEGCI